MTKRSPPVLVPCHLGQNWSRADDLKFTTVNYYCKYDEIKKMDLAKNFEVKTYYFSALSIKSLIIWAINHQIIVPISCKTDMSCTVLWERIFEKYWNFKSAANDQFWPKWHGTKTGGLLLVTSIPGSIRFEIKNHWRTLPYILNCVAPRGLYICLGPKQSLLKQSHWSENSHIGFIFFEVFSNLKSHFHGKIQVALPPPASLLSH